MARIGKSSMNSLDNICAQNRLDRSRSPSAGAHNNTRSYKLSAGYPQQAWQAKALIDIIDTVAAVSLARLTIHARHCIPELNRGHLVQPSAFELETNTFECYQAFPVRQFVDICTRHLYSKIIGWRINFILLI
jgi:hypothetical protein